MTKSEVKLHMHPATYMDLSNAITEAGAGSDGQYAEFISGRVPMIGGVEVVENKYIGRDEVLMIPVNSIGTPDADVMTTRIANKTDDLNFVDVIRGQHFFDSVLVTPSLVTRLTFGVAALKAEIKEAQKEAKVAEKDFDKAVKEAAAKMVEAEKAAKAEAKKLERAQKETEARLAAEAEAKKAAEAQAEARKAAQEAAKKAQSLSN